MKVPTKVKECSKFKDQSWGGIESIMVFKVFTKKMKKNSPLCCHIVIRGIPGAYLSLGLDVK